jgi:2-haloacid dehalogenase
MTGPAHAPALDTVLFDLGGVLIDWNPRHVYREHFGRDVAAMEDFLARVVPMTWNHEMDAGKPFDEAVRERQALFPEHAALIALWRDRWPDMLGGPIEPTVGLLRELRGAGLRLLALTNWSAETFPVARDRYGFLDWFETIFVSGEERLAKPDPRFFELALARGALVPARTLFIDDNVANIETAEAMGFDTHRFVEPEGLRSALIERRLLVAA